MKQIFAISILLFFISCTLFGQNDSLIIDSLEKVLPTQKEDTSRINTMLALSLHKMSMADTGSLQYAVEALSLAEKAKFKKGIAGAYTTIAAFDCFYNGNCLKALEKARKALKIYETLHNKEEQANCYNLIGNFYRNMNNTADAVKNYMIAISIGKELKNKNIIINNYWQTGVAYYFNDNNYSEALKNYYLSLKFARETGDKYWIARCLSDIGRVNTDQGNYAEALENDAESLKMYKELENRNGMAEAFDRLGDVYFALGRYEEAMYNDSMSYVIFRQLHYTGSMASALSGVGQSYEAIGDIANKAGDRLTAKSNFNKALVSYLESITLGKVDKGGAAYYYAHAGSIYTKLKNFATAKKYLLKSLEISKETGLKDNFVICYKPLSALDSAMGNYKQGYEHYKLYILYRDSLVNEESTKKSLQSKMQYDFGLKETIARTSTGKERCRSQTHKESAIFCYCCIRYCCIGCYNYCINTI